VDARTAETPKHKLGALVTEGKTKRIHRIAGNPDLVTVMSKDDITAGDGAKHDVIPGKGRLATATTCNVFPAAEGLRAAGRLRGAGQRALLRGPGLHDAAL